MLSDRLHRALPDLPPQLALAGQQVAADPLGAATRSMRQLAARAGTSPATFSRLAQALGFEGWEALREAAIAEHRAAAHPYSDRAAAPGRPRAIYAADLANLETLAAAPSAALEAAAAALHAAPRIHVAGFRSCRAVAELLRYQLRLFRPDTALLGESALDLDLGTLRAGEALVLVGFAPYSRAGVATAAAARAAGATLVALTDAPDAPVAAGAAHRLVFGTATPAFFPSLTAAVSLAQALAAAVLAQGGAESLARLRETEARLATHAAYVTEEPIA